MAASKAARSSGPEVGGGAQGASFKQFRGRTVWEASTPSEEEVEALRRRFPQIVSVSEEVLRLESEVWEATAVVARSLGRRLSMEVILREFRHRAGLRGDVSGSYMDHGVFVLRFSVPADRDSVLLRPWVVAGQAIALEAWRPEFFPSPEAVGTALVWVRLPCLPVEFWSREALREVVSLAGELTAVDEWTASRSRLGFARVCIRISLDQPLRPGILLQGRGRCFWQNIVYENLNGVCLSCGRFHGQGDCGGGGNHKENQGLSEANLSEQSMEEEGADVPGPVLGPWALAVRRWLPASGGGQEPLRNAPSRRPGKEPEVNVGNRGGRRASSRGRWVVVGSFRPKSHVGKLF